VQGREIAIIGQDAIVGFMVPMRERLCRNLCDFLNVSHTLLQGYMEELPVSYSIKDKIKDKHRLWISF